MQFDHNGPGFVFLFVLLRFGLQAFVVLQSLLPALHCHVEAGEDAAVPAVKWGTDNLRHRRALKQNTQTHTHKHTCVQADKPGHSHQSTQKEEKKTIFLL